MKVELITNTRCDLTVVNAARVSFSKESVEFTYRKDKPKGSDEGLLAYLARENHWTPFSHVRESFELSEPFPFAFVNYTAIAGMVWEDSNFVRHSLWGWANLLRMGVLHKHDQQHIAKVLTRLYPESMKAMGLYTEGATDQQVELHELTAETATSPDFIDITLRETIPIFIARQRFKHMVGFTYNEVSRRYVDDEPEYHEPEVWRSRPEASIKQGSGLNTVETLPVKYVPTKYGSVKRTGNISEQYQGWLVYVTQLYNNMLEGEVAPEQARMVLPQSMYTSYYVTAPLTAWARAYKQRIHSTAQKEIQELAKQWDAIIRSQHPVIWSELVD